MKNKISAIKITKPMVLIPIEEYEDLLFEAGILKTPKLDKEIKKAKKELKEGKVVDWEKIKGEII